MDVLGGEPLGAVLQEMVNRGASDILLLAGVPPVIRIHGRLQYLNESVLLEATLREWLTPHLGEHARKELETRGAADFSLRLVPAQPESSWRFRVNLHTQRRSLAAALRVLPAKIPTLSSLNLPESLASLLEVSRGLILLCGPTGCGKSSTLAALIGEINRQRACHIITIEDPIEYEHANQRAIIEHIEIGADAVSFAEALRAALRQNPDVILVGEMRDLDTVSTALTAAETGHLILSTLHTNDAAQTVHRVVDVFPPVQQTQIRQQLALCLNAIVCQQLIPRADRTARVPAVEVLTATYAVRQHIRSGQLQNLYSEMTVGKRTGMITMEESLARLVKAGAISLEEAKLRASHADELDGYLRKS
jgi:twitching motility protein PilT